MRMKFIAYDPNSGEKLSLKEHIHHMDKYTTYVLVMKRQYGFQSTEKQIFEISQYTSNMMVEISRKLYYLIGEY
ncbi:hypothetical protein BANRA_02930 [Acinetobacter baumannii]|nr:hypothetical protein BANRA_02930 [Acinetobacter baumannii]